MNIVFIENRYKTFLWSKIANSLKSDFPNTKISWIIQNKLFKRPKGIDLYIPFPKKNNLSSDRKVILEDIYKMDRGNYLYNNGGLHYNYYYEKIKEHLIKLRPSIIFSECTLFHELITAKICNELNILFITPSSSRYPVGHFSFYKNGTLIPYNNKKFDVQEYDIKLTESISERKHVPDYMKKPTGLNYLSFKLKLLLNNLTSLLSWIYGEKYNTPSPIKKIKLNKLLRKNIEIWESNYAVDKNKIEDWSNVVLYPLQMQPESNIDVWGYPFNDQAENLKRLSDAIPKDNIIVIKPNPKSKYEINNKLLETIDQLNNVVCLSHSVNMDEIFNQINTVYTVTGTVGIESILADKKIITERNTVLLGYPNVSILEKSNILHIPATYSKYQLIANIRGNSFLGLISDPIHSNYCISQENILNITNAIKNKFFNKSELQPHENNTAQ
ncbi:hypothetical protein [Photorhabdus sp. RM323S]|uniref:capsular polysaccharide export protein, LipB/KpsS family n=1 Tax=Photorhabdus sp. RM323S TaxID=3342828 RepID=UPI0036D89213